MIGEISEEARRAIADALGQEDHGLTRFQRAARRKALGDEVCQQVASRHGLSMMAVQNPGRGIKKRHHIVMARSHAAATLRDVGLSFIQIGVILCCNRASARRMALRWDDHKAGRLETVSEVDARRVDTIVDAKGITQAEACAEAGIGFTGYQSRKIMMGQVG